MWAPSGTHLSTSTTALGAAEIFENQWRWPSGWRDVPPTRSTAGGSSIGASSAAVTGLAMPPWSCCAGRFELHPVTMPAPAGCAWAGEWEVDLSASGGAEAQGWLYAPDASSLLRGTGATKQCWDKSWPQAVRRRRYVRRYVVVDAAKARGAGVPQRSAADSHDRSGAVAGDRSLGTGGTSRRLEDTASLSPPRTHAAGADSCAPRHPAPAAAGGAPAGRHAHAHAAARPAAQQQHPLALPPLASLRLPQRGARDELPFATLAEDIRRLVGAVHAVRKAVSHVGGERDSQPLRAWARGGLAAVRGSLAGLEACTRSSARAAVAAVEEAVAGALSRPSALGGTAAGGRSGSVPGYVTPAGAAASLSAFDASAAEPAHSAPHSSWAHHHAGGALLSGDRAARSLAGDAGGRGTGGRGTAGGSSAATSVVSEKRRWEKLTADLQAAATLYRAEADTFTARCELAPVPRALVDSDPALAAASEASGDEGGEAPLRGSVSRPGDGKAAPLLRARAPAPPTVGPAGGEPLSPSERSAGEPGHDSRVGRSDAYGGHMRGVVDSEGGVGSLQRASLLESEVDFTSALVEERTRHIDSITGEVAEVAQLFQDLRGIVVDQGEILATVERNTEQAKAHTQAGVQHLHAADKIDREGGCVVM